MSHRSSTNDRRHPYMIASKVNKFWNDKPLPGSLIGPYSEEQKDHFNERLLEFSRYKWPPNKLEKKLTPYLKKKLGL